MSLLVTFSGPDTPESGPARRLAAAAARRQGFVDPVEFHWPEGSARWYATPGNPRGSGACVREGSDFAAYCGTVHWSGLTGEPLLRRLLADFDKPQDMPLMDFSGGFAMLFARQGRVWLFADALGLQRLYADSSGAVTSTSFMVCRALLTRPRLHRLRAQEYVLLGSNHARQTPLADIAALDPVRCVDLRSGTSEVLHQAAAWSEGGVPPASLDEAVASLSGFIAEDFAGMLAAFGPRVGMALSGGFDSRLLLAALHHHGVLPTLYVYGRPGDSDVRVAMAKARDLGIDIEPIDKAPLSATLEPLSVRTIADNLHFFDGLPVDGVFDRGADRITRLRQVQGGTLNLNGGGGEVLRNFFLLPDRSYGAANLVDAFYLNFLPAVLPTREDRQAFADAAADGMLEGLGLPFGDRASRSRPMPRRTAELVYALFRLRWWMARNNSLASRHGAFATPLVHPRLVQRAAVVPLAWKTYGDLEAAIIKRLSPRVASGPSDYGFDFAEGPTGAHRRLIDATLVRPLFVRRHAPTLRHWLGKNPKANTPPEWAAALAPQPADWIRPEHFTDASQINRLLTLQAVLDDGLAGTQ